MDMSKRTILLVEDEAILAYTEKIWLTREGYNVIHTIDGEQAIGRVRDDSDLIDLILMDIDLGRGIDGTQAADEILKIRDIPILFLSSHTEKEIVDKTEKITSYGYVVKGSGETVLFASIKMAFKLHNAKKSIQAKEAALHKISENLSITLQSIGDGVIATDTEGCVTRMNQVAEHLCGWTLGEAQGKSLTEVFRIVNAKTRQVIDNPVAEVLETGKRVGLANHTLLISRDGSEYQIFDSAAPICDQSGRTFGVVLVFSDVTEKYKKEELLKESEERLRFALEGANDGIWGVDLKTGEVYVSPRDCEILGYKPGEAHEIAKVWSDLVYEEDLPVTNKMLEKYLNKQTEIFEVEQRLKTKSGELKWVLTRGKAVLSDENGNPLRMSGTHTDITTRKRSEIALRESEEHFRALYENAPLGYQSLDANAYFIDVNESWLEIMGYKREEVIGKWFGSFMTPPYQEKVKKGFPMFVANGQVHAEADMIKKDGSVIKIAFDGRIGHKPNGEFKQTHCILRDITEIANTKEEHLKSEQLFRTLIEEAPVPVSIVRNGITVYTNSIYAQMFGFEDADEFIGKSVLEQVAPESRGEISGYIKKRANGEVIPNEFEITGLRKNGERFPLYVRTSLVQLPDGSATIGFLTDMTEPYQIKQSLYESEERLGFVIEGGKIGFWDWNIVSGEVHYNQQWAGILGYKYENIKPTVSQWEDLLHPDDRSRAWEFINNTIAGISPVDEIEYRMLASDGSYKWISDRAFITSRDAEGKPVRMSGIHLDITERKQHELQLKQYTEELKVSNATKDKYFSILSHDLRGPLGGFLGLTKELAENIEGIAKKEVAAIASIMYKSAEETYALLTNLLEWSKLQTGKFEFHPVGLDLFQEVESVKSLFTPASAQKSILVNNNVFKGTEVLADKNALSTVLRNLIDNAIKFTHEAGSITIDSSRCGDFVEVSVADSGVGMSKEVLEKIFNINTAFTTNGTNSEKGFGLGIVLCQDLVQRGGGELKAISRENEGTVFTFSLPVLENI